MRAVDFILQVTAAEIFVIRPLKFHSVAGRTTNIGRNANVAARRESGSGLVETDRKSTRLNSSHLVISYAVFCLKKKKKKYRQSPVQDKDRDTSTNENKTTSA